ncbi:hypothetical protein [Brevibacillus nitrificans]|uniref:hypothetical protein n=1 Tax=Brevibacillus nitrificans TaxID=651560 RepID=UPI002863A175|nr:hypothetical protein [Brevibacillus nitrificans]MDR7318902.1 hypothetical protein [Brevibacillus nitrificans]
MATLAQKELAANITKDLVIAFAERLGKESAMQRGEVTNAIAECYAAVFDTVLIKITQE